MLDTLQKRLDNIDDAGERRSRLEEFMAQLPQ